MSADAPTTPELLDLLARTTDKDGWLDPLLADQDSSTVLKAQADIFAHLGQVSKYDTSLGLITTAPGGDPATCVLTMARAASGTAGTIPAGYRFQDARGLQLVLQTAVAVLAGDLQVVLPLASLRQTELADTVDDPGVTISPQSPIVLDATASSVLIAPPGSAGIVSTTFTVIVGSTPLDGGHSDYLSLHGDERAQPRQPNEATEAYRARVRNIPDAVSPIAISDAVQGAAQSAGLPPFEFEEPFSDGATPALKEAHFLSSFDSAYCDADFLSDAPMGDFRTSRAYFQLVPTGVLNNPDGSGLFLDDGFLDDPGFGFLDTGFHPKLLASLMSIWEEANQKRAGGVQFDLFAFIPERMVAVGQDKLNVVTEVWSMTAPPGRAWTWVDGFFNHDFPSGIPSGSPFHRIRFTFSDASTFTLPDWFRTDDQHYLLDQLLAMGFPWKPITLIEGFIESDGVNPVNLVGTVYVIEGAL